MARSFRRLGFNQPQPKTRIRRWFYRIGQMLFILILLYISLYTFPQILFPYSYSSQGVTIYARSPLPPEEAATNI